MAASWLDELNPAQRQAVTHGDGPLLVIAGAGTGKTRTLACRVAWLVQHGVPPGRILLLTFTRRAAAEMLARAGRLMGEAAAGRVWGGTFHAVANRLLRQYGRALGLSPEFTVMDASDAADLMNVVRNDLGAARKDRRFPRKQTLAAIYSRAVNAQEKLSDVLERHFPWCRADRKAIAEIFDAYAARKVQRQVLDYDDLLLFWKALCDSPGVGPRVAGLFDHVLVDEYQDTNRVQADILRGMRRDLRNIMVVGDDAQSIYSFRAATVRNILDFPKQFDGAAQVTLDQNYRSTQPILDASNAVMEHAAQRYTKNLWSNRRSEQKPLLTTCRDEEQQTRLTCENILAHLEQGTPLRQQAVLFRTGHHSAQLEVELARRNIPFHKYGGLKFIEAGHVKDVLALLRIVENPYDEISWFRVLGLLEGVGPRTAKRIIEALGVCEDRALGDRPLAGHSAQQTEARSNDDRPEARRPKDRPEAGPPETGSPVAVAPDSPLVRMFLNPPPLPPTAKAGFSELAAALLACRGLRAASASKGRSKQRSKSSRRDHDRSQAGPDQSAATPRLVAAAEPPLSAQIERLQRFYQPVCLRVYDNGPIRLRDVEQLERIAAGARSRSRFITDLTLDPPTSTSDLAQPPFLEEDWLTLSTIHSAKGCEWTVVHVIHAADGMMPSDMATGDSESIDEERRLFYVALTRAKDWLYVYFPLRYYHRRFNLGDRHSYAQLTRFLPAKARRLFEQRAAAMDDADAAAPDVEPADASAVRARVSALWRE